jgi:hypothetical protein
MFSLSLYYVGDTLVIMRIIISNTLRGRCLLHNKKTCVILGVAPLWDDDDGGEMLPIAGRVDTSASVSPCLGA